MKNTIRYQSRPSPTNTHVNNSSPKPYPPPARFLNQPTIPLPPWLFSGKQATLLVQSFSSAPTQQVSKTPRMFRAGGPANAKAIAKKSQAFLEESQQNFKSWWTGRCKRKCKCKIEREYKNRWKYKLFRRRRSGESGGEQQTSQKTRS